MKTNKEIIDKLVEYYLKQDPRIVARLLANCQIDLNRWINMGNLDLDEKMSLVKRTRLNMEEMFRFLNEGSNVEQLTLGSLDD